MILLVCWCGRELGWKWKQAKRERGRDQTGKKKFKKMNKNLLGNLFICNTSVYVIVKCEGVSCFCFYIFSFFLGGWNCNLPGQRVKLTAGRLYMW